MHDSISLDFQCRYAGENWTGAQPCNNPKTMPNYRTDNENDDSHFI